ncbi:MAG: SSU ribosomal protein S7p (S5e), partial [uncultured Solirubrobacteraceae bacterium]
APPRSRREPDDRSGSRPPLPPRPAGHQQGDAAREEVHRRGHRVRRAGDHRRAHRQGPARAPRGVGQVAHAAARGPLAPRRRRHLPGARRGPRPPLSHARRPLARRVLAQPPREDHGPAPGQRAHGRRQPAGRRLQAQGRHLPHGPGQQGLRALPLV